MLCDEYMENIQEQLFSLLDFWEEKKKKSKCQIINFYENDKFWYNYL